MLNSRNFKEKETKRIWIYLLNRQIKEYCYIYERCRNKEKIEDHLADKTINNFTDEEQMSKKFEFTKNFVTITDYMGKPNMH